MSDPNVRCDKCGAVLNDLDRVTLAVRWGILTRDDRTRLDFCGACCDALVAWLATPLPAAPGARQAAGAA
jgi:hypothetical protein